MPASDRRYEDFRIGDYVSFVRRFQTGDFQKFAGLSGDRNPLHHDEAYAKQSEFGRTIVPLHLAAAPMSAIAGMMLPGHRALYLSTEMRAVKPVFYGQDLTYSAKVVSKHDSSRVLSIRVIAFHGDTVLLDGEMRVRVRDDIGAGAWRDEAETPIANAAEQRVALITGAVGGIGSAVSTILARRGWALILQYRGNPAGAERLKETCTRHGTEVSLVAGALDTAEGRRAILKALADLPEISAIIHSASPRIDAGLDKLMTVTYTSLRDLAGVALPGMLRRQEGRILLLGSSAVQSHPLGWDDYVAAKAAAMSFVNALSHRYAPYGILGCVVSPGYVQTPFSEAYRPAGTGLLPEEVAEVVAERLEASESDHTYVWVEPHHVLRGEFGFHEAGARAVFADRGQPPSVADERANAAQISSDGRAEETEDLDRLVRQFLKLPQTADLHAAGLDATPGWDSLRHIELMLFLESALGISFSSEEISQTTRFADLKNLIRAKRGRPTRG